MITETVLFIVTILIAGLLVSRGLTFRPAGIFALLVALNATVFYGVVCWGIAPDSVSTHWQVLRSDSYRIVGWQVLTLYLILAIVAAASSTTVENGALRIRRGAHPWIAPDSVTKLPSGVRRSITACILGLCMVAVLHVMEVEWRGLYEYSRYLLVRTDPSVVGIQGVFSESLHRNIATIGLVSATIFGFLLSRREWVLAAACAPAFIYFILVTIAFNSRIAVLDLGVVALQLAVVRSRWTRGTAFLLAVAAYALYGAFIELRNTSSLGDGSFGLGPVLSLVGTRGVSPLEDQLFYLFYNSFGSGFMTAEAFLHPGLRYPLEYKLLSFSPLPSAIDGFDAVRGIEQQNRVIPWGPFGAFSEAYYFGLPYLVALLCLLGASMARANRLAPRLNASLAFLAMLPMYYVSLRLFSYPIRGTSRLFFAAVLLLECVALLATTRVGRQLNRALGGKGDPADPAAEFHEEGRSDDPSLRSGRAEGILLVSSSRTKQGGAELRMVELADELRSRGTTVHLALPVGGGSESLAGHTCHMVLAPRPRRTSSVWAMLTYFRLNFVSVWRLRRQLRGEGIRVVHANELLELPSVVAAKLAGFRTVMHIRVILERPRWLSLGLRIGARLFSDRIVCVSQAVQARMFPAGGRGISVVYDGGPNPEEFSLNAVTPKSRSELNVNANDVLVGVVGKIAPNKGQLVVTRAAIQALKVRPHLRFFFLSDPAPGYEDYARACKAEVAAAGLEDEIRFVGYQDNVRAWLGALDIFVHAPIHHDPFPGVVLEAMALEKPVIGTDSGGIPEQIRPNVTGLLVPRNDSTTLVQAILSLADDAEKRQAFGRAGRETLIGRFSQEKLYAEMDALYRSI